MNFVKQSRLAAGICVIVCLTTVPTFAQEAADPFQSPETASEQSEWGNPDEMPFPGSDGGRSSNQLGERDPLTFGGIGCPVLISGDIVVSSASLKPIRRLNLGSTRYSSATLSNDGRVFAISVPAKENENVVVSVWNTETGERVAEIVSPFGDAKLNLLRITRNRYIATGWGKSNEIQVWDAGTGKQIKAFTLSSKASIENKSVAFSNDGRYFAVVEHSELNVYDVAKSKVVAKMQPPKKEVSESERQSRSATMIQAMHANDEVFFYAWIQSISFSPDGKELAAVSTHTGNHLFCWNQRASLENKISYALAENQPFWKNCLQWLPDGNGWLIAGNLIDRVSGRVLLALEQPFASNVEAFVYDQNTLLTRLASSPDKITRVNIPWDKLAAAQKAIEDQVPAYLAPYHSVDVRLEFGDLRGSQPEAEDTLRKAIVNRLARDGISVKAGSGDYFRLRLSETAGDTLPIYERQAFEFRGRDTGRTVAEAKGTVLVEFYAEGDSKPLWREVLSSTSSRMFLDQEINDQTVRESMLKSVGGMVSRINFPYFLPKDDGIAALPIMVP